MSAATVALTGCAPNVGGFAVLDKPMEASDELPANVHDFDDGELPADFSTAHLIGEHNGSRVWFMRDIGGTGLCFFAYADEAVTASSCVTPEGPIEVGTPAIDFYVVPDGEPGPDNATKISENLYAKG